MKIKEGYVLREVAGKAVVIAVGEASRTFHGMINLNSTGKCIWEGAAKGLEKEEIVKSLTEQYQVDVETAERDVEKMLRKMAEVGVLEF